MDIDTATFTYDYIDFQGNTVPWDNVVEMSEGYKASKLIHGGMLLAYFDQDKNFVEHVLVIYQGYV